MTLGEAGASTRRVDRSVRLTFQAFGLIPPLRCWDGLAHHRHQLLSHHPQVRQRDRVTRVPCFGEPAEFTSKGRR